MSCTAAFNQKTFRARDDNGNETTASWKAEQGANWRQAKDQNFRVRFEIQETAACAKNNVVWQLQYNKNAAGWVTVNASSVVVRSSASPNLADAANLTNKLTVGTGTFQGATGFDEVDGAAGGASMDLAASGHAEAEFCVQIRSADVADDDTIQLRVTDSGVALAAYDATPTVTVSGTNIGGLLRIPQDTKRKPRSPGNCRVRSDGLGQGLAGAWLLNEGGGLTARSLVGGSALNGTLNGGPPWSVPGGVLFGGQLAGDYIDCGQGVPQSTKRTVVARIRQTSLTLTNDMVFSIGASVGGEHCYLAFNTGVSNKLSFGFGATDETFPEVGWVTDFVANVWYTVVGTYDGTIFNLYVDGLLKATASNAKTPKTLTMNTYLGNYIVGTARGFGGDIDYVLWYTRALTAVEVALLQAEPFVFLQPCQGEIAFGGESVSLSEIAGTAAIVFSQAAALTGAGALLGTAAIVFADAASLTGAGALLGTSAITFTEAGTITGAGALLGTSAIVFAGTNTLTGAGALAGTSALVISATGTATSLPTDIAGTAALAFTQSATLTGAGALIGTAAVAVSQAGALAGAGALLGAAPLTFTEAAALTGAGALLGTSALTISGTALLIGIVDIAGTSALVLTGSATLTGVSALAGTSALVFSQTAALTGSGALLGTSALVITGTGTATGAGALAGSSALLIAGTGLLTGAGALTGSSSLTLPATATIQGFAAISGTAAIVLSATATLTGAGSLAGTSPLTITGTGVLTGAGALTGNAPLVISGTAVVTGSAPITGTAVLTITAGGTATVLNQLIAATVYYRATVHATVKIHATPQTTIRFENTLPETVKVGG